MKFLALVRTSTSDTARSWRSTMWSGAARTSAGRSSSATTPTRRASAGPTPCSPRCTTLSPRPCETNSCRSENLAALRLPRYHVFHAAHHSRVHSLHRLHVRRRSSQAAPPRRRAPRQILRRSHAGPRRQNLLRHIDIDVDLAKPASLIWLNSTDLTIEQAAVASQPAAIEPGNDDFVGLRAAKILGPGPARIHIVYQGKISHKGSAGIFQGIDGEQPYLFTQFEAGRPPRLPLLRPARYQNSLAAHPARPERSRRRLQHLARLRNRRAQRHEEGGLRAHQAAAQLPGGLRRRTLRVVDAGKAGQNHMPVRIIAPKGKPTRPNTPPRSPPLSSSAWKTISAFPIPMRSATRWPSR